MAGLTGVITGLTTNAASALEYTSNSVPVSFTYSEVLTVSTGGNILIPSLSPGNSTISANNYVVTVSTNSVAGYTLSATVGCASGDGCFNSKALGDGNNNNFAMVESTTALTPGRWGVSFDTSATTSSNFQTLPLYSGTAETINQTTNADGAAAIGYHGTQNTPFRIGAYADENQVAGTYTNVVNFIAVANVVVTHTYMQDFTASDCQSLASDEGYTVYDKRDENDYSVRYIEGACWMTQNLRIVGTVDSNNSNFSTYDSVNVCEGDLTDGYSYDELRCHDSGDTTNGVWYIFVAATAKTIVGESNAMVATEDICPANWHLPSYDTTNPAGSINSLSSTSDTSVLKFSPVTDGGYSNGSLSYTGNGSWWSTTANSTFNRYGLSYDGSRLNPAVIAYRSGGVYVRCVRL